MNGARRRLIVALVVMLPASARAQQPAAQIPSFRASVEVTSLDVSVVDDHGKPILDLKPEDFNIRVDGKDRKVVSSEWVRMTADSAEPLPEAPPAGFSTNARATGGRLVVIAIDQPNIRFGGALAITRAAGTFVDHLQPSDRIAVAGIGVGAASTPFISDRARIKAAIARMVGQKQAGRNADYGHNISVSEALQVENGGDRLLLQQLGERECAGIPANSPPGILCRDEVEMQVRQLAFDSNHEGDQTITALRELLMGLRGIEGPKTLVLVSEGFVMQNQAEVIELGSLAAASRTSLYALQLDNQLFDLSDGRASRNPMGDRRALAEGLEMLAGAARGALFTVAGTPEALFDRIEAEISGYYLIGVESDAKDRDGKPHPIRVDVPRRGAIVRSRRQYINAAADAPARRSGRQAVAAALGSPLIVSGLPLRVASFALQGPEANRVQILIHSDIGTDYASSKVVTGAYVISDASGKMIDNKAFDARVLPVMNGVPSPLQFKIGASVPPGEYSLKLAVAEGDRVGTIEHTIHAALPAASGLTFSELMVGGPLDIGELLQPTIGYQVNFGMVHGYFETYGKANPSDEISVEYEIATDEQSPALLNVDVPSRPAGDTRAIFTKTMAVNQLPPGPYVLRAVVSVNNRSVKTLTRGFEVSPPKVLMTSADGLGAGMAVETGLFLPVDESTVAQPFKPSQAIDSDTLKPFRDRQPVETREAFEQGIAFLAAAEYPKAEQAFKRAIQPEVDSTPALAYLAASFAAAAQDSAAASAFQTALVDGDDMPQIYDWLGATLMRTHGYGEARAIYEEAIGKWPSDTRFAKPLSMLYAMLGRGREAVRTLERYLERKNDDRDAYYQGVQWIYTVHVNGAIVHDRATDKRLAHDYADAYANGPQAPLVRQWIAYLDGEK
jgi:VWFA-related protein